MSAVEQDGRSSGMSEIGFHLLAGFLLVLLVAATYLPVGWAGFVFDDIPYVLENPAVVTADIGSVFADTFPPNRPDQALYRPVVTLSYRLDRLVTSDPARWAFVAHLHSVCLHMVVCLLLFSVLFRFGSGTGAFLSAAAYAVHPVLTESVAWVAGRSEVLFGFWALVGLVCMLHPRIPAWRKAVWLGLVAALGMLTKESAVMLPVVWAVAGWGMPAQAEGRRGRARWLVPLPAFGIALAAVALRVVVFGRLSPVLVAFSDVGVGDRYKVVFAALHRYLYLLVMPGKQTVHWPPFPVAIHYLAVLAGVLLLCALLSAAIVGGRRRRLWGVGAAWFLLMLLPYSNFLVRIGTVMAERFLYVPVMGIAFALLAVMNRLQRLAGRVAAAAPVIAAVVLVTAWARATYSQASAWQSNLTLWTAAAEAYPGDWVARTAVVFYLVKEGDDLSRAKAVKQWPEVRAALAQYPDYAFPPTFLERRVWIDTMTTSRSVPLPRKADQRLTLAVGMLDNGYVLDALKILEQFVLLFPDNAASRMNTARACLGMTDEHRRVRAPDPPESYLDAALRHLAAARELIPADPVVYAMKGSCYKRRGDNEAAINSYSAALVLNPKDFRSWYNRAMVFLQQENMSAALHDLQMALACAPVEEHVRIQSMLDRIPR